MCTYLKVGQLSTCDDTRHVCKFLNVIFTNESHLKIFLAIVSHLNFFLVFSHLNFFWLLP